MSFYLAIVSPLDSPIFELTFQSSKPPPPISASTNQSASATASSSSSSFPSWSTFTSSNGSDLAIPPSSATAGSVPGDASRGLSVGSGSHMGERHMLQMIAHSSLDVVEEIMESTGALYLKSIDRHNEWIVSAFLATNVKFILLHDVKNEDGIRLFFLDLWESYVKVLLNPFHTVNTPIRNPMFEAKVRANAKRNL